MHFNITCKCGRRFRIAERFAGRTLKCPACDARHLVPVSKSDDATKQGRGITEDDVLELLESSEETANVAKVPVPQPHSAIERLALSEAGFNAVGSDNSTTSSNSNSPTTGALSNKSQFAPIVLDSHQSLEVGCGTVAILITLVAFVLFCFLGKPHPSIAYPGLIKFGGFCLMAGLSALGLYANFNTVQSITFAETVMITRWTKSDVYSWRDIAKVSFEDSILQTLQPLHGEADQRPKYISRGRKLIITPTPTSGIATWPAIEVGLPGRFGEEVGLNYFFQAHGVKVESFGCSGHIKRANKHISEVTQESALENALFYRDLRDNDLLRPPLRIPQA